MLKLVSGGSTRLDIADFKKFKRFRWYLHTGGYAYRPTCVAGVKGNVYLHRAILCPPDGKETDHINGDKLDNRKRNLRVATSSQNKGNKPVRLFPGKTSRFKGVYFNKERSLWMARIKENDRSIFLGRFASQEEAAVAYNAAAEAQWGEFAQPNPV